MAQSLSPQKVKKIWKESFSKSVSVNKLPFKEAAGFAATINLVLVVLVLLLSHFKRIPPEVPLYYGSAEGQGQLAINWQLVFPQILSLLFLGTNTLLSYLIKEEFIKKALVIGAIALTFLSAVTTLKIIGLVGNF